MKIFLHCCCFFFLLLQSSGVAAQDFNLKLRSKLEFPGELTRGVWGYVKDGREYALLSGTRGMIVADVTNPDSPLVITKIPDTLSTLQEIRTFSHYAYAATYYGLLIVDLNGLPDTNLSYKFYIGDGPIQDQMKYIHTLHIDEKKGFLYANGVDNIAPVVILDLNADPFNPTYAGVVTGVGMHDCYVENDTLYGGSFSVVSVIDVSDKSNPVLLGTAPTPGGIAHNAWPLDNHQYVLTTDESKPSFLTAFDISDPEDIKEVGRVSSNDGYGALTHNTQVLNDWAITGWYKDGVVIVDAHRPENLVVTGRYDTWIPNNHPYYYLGCWGVYSYLPSGNILAGNYVLDHLLYRGELFVFTPDYRRSCYLEGIVTDAATGLPLPKAEVEIIGNPYSIRMTALDGVYKTGQPEEGTVQVRIRKDGYCPDTVTANLIAGQITILDIALAPCPPFTISGYVIDSATGAPVPNARILLRSQDKKYETFAINTGFFSIPNVFIGTYDVYFEVWGWDLGSIPGKYFYAADSQMVLPLKDKLYYDDFLFNFFWKTAGQNGDGKWELDEPIPFFSDSSWYYVPMVGSTDTIFIGPPADSDLDANDRCYITGNNSFPLDDVDVTTVLTSPPMKLSNYQDGILSFWYWYYDDGPAVVPDNHLEVRAISMGDTVTVFSQHESAEIWRFSGDIHLADHITLSDGLLIQFVVSIDDTLSYLEITKAAIDVFRVVPEGLISGTVALDKAPALSVFPNPSTSAFTIQYQWPGARQLFLEIYNTLGQVVAMRTLEGEKGNAVFGHDWPNGIYLAVLRDGGGQGSVLKLIKQ